MNCKTDSGGFNRKIPLATIVTTTEASRLDVMIACLCQTQRAKHLYKCLAQSVTSKVRDNLDPYIKSIWQDGPLLCKYLMLEVASNPSSEAETRDICQMLSRVNLIKHMKSERNNVKSFNLYVHSQLTKLAFYTHNLPSSHSTPPSKRKTWMQT